MKKIIFLLLITIQLQAQQTYCDSSILAIQKEFKQIKTNIYKAQDLQKLGNTFHVVGIWCQVIAITGYKQDYYDAKTYRKVALYSLGFNILAYSLHLYSHKFVNEAALEVTPGSLKVTF